MAWDRFVVCDKLAPGYKRCSCLNIHLVIGMAQVMALKPFVVSCSAQHTQDVAAHVHAADVLSDATMGVLVPDSGQEKSAPRNYLLLGEWPTYYWASAQAKVI